MRISDLLLAGMLLLPASSYSSTPNIIPQPAHYVSTEGNFRLPAQFIVSGYESSKASDYLKRHGINASVSASGSNIVVSLNESLQPESYVLDIRPDQILIEAADLSGLMYAIESLSQLIDQNINGAVSACVITDSPRMQYRGLMIDVVRCYLPVDELKKFVDVAAQLKLNKLHLHLTDDNGWRMQINQYPKLTEVGAWRVDRKELFPGRANPKEGEPTTYGGYYTQDELRDLVAYAAERQIDVIPEIEMPAHAVAAIASYPELTCPVYDEFIGVLSGIGGKAASIIMCAGNDNTLNFVTNVLDEVMDVFPYEYIHLGGDEANKSHWEKCPKCNARIEEHGLKGYEELQAWFMDSINSYVRQHGRTAIGWDEVTYGKPKEDMVIMGWQGDGSVAVNYARETGRRFIMTPAKSTYLIRYQGPQWFEPFTYFGNITLKDAYDFEPVQNDWTEQMHSQLWGVQGSMWTEFCREPADVQHQVFPRLIAIADVAWRPEGARDWDGFIHGTDNMLKRLDSNGINWAKSMYNLQHKIVPNGDGTVTVYIENIRPDAHIMVADNADFENYSLYAGPIVLGNDADLYFMASFPDGTQGQALHLPIAFNKATGLSVEQENCRNNLQGALTNGLHGSLRNSDFEWAGWYGEDAAFAVDLGAEKDINSVFVSVLANANMIAGLPAAIRIHLAGEDGEFRLCKTIPTLATERFPLNPVSTKMGATGLNEKARYIRIEAENPGKVPDGMPREGTSTWLYFDEIIVE